MINSGDAVKHSLPWTRTLQEVQQDLSNDESEGDVGPLEYRFDVATKSTQSVISGPLNLLKTVKFVPSEDKIKRVLNKTEIELTMADGNKLRQACEYGNVTFENVLVGPIHIEILENEPEEGKSDA